jgi:replicative DNA helicase
MQRAGVAPTLIVIDHQGLIANHERHASELEAARSRGNQLKAIAKRLNVWLVALAQVTKEGARKDGDEHLPTLDDIAYGGALTQAADVVILLHRKAYYAERKPAGALSMDDHRAKNSLIATLIIDKARGGRRGRVDAIMDVSSAILRDAQAGELEDQ